ncbi:MAG: choice-of-anchor L domain-containing protein [Bacteroidetes bacterium]|nr:choice-of-anchor L domain-containing protein [Bacteroidota bacterium]
MQLSLKKGKSNLIILLVLLLTSTTGLAQLTVTAGVTPQQLVNSILGGGVTVSNVTYNGNPISCGTFTATGSNLGMTAGITISTGDANQTGNANVFADDILNEPGDNDLDNIASPTYDAAILEFDFAAPSDSVEFKYIFSSEEYNEYVNTPFNDVFAFFISGPGIVGLQNIALLPNTAIPVAINNVNNGFSNGASTGPCTNCAYYIDNDGGASFYMDGLTTVLKAKAYITPCLTYHIKIAIADVGDENYNSAVFIEGGSFTSYSQLALYVNNAEVPDNDTVFACPGSIVTLSLNNLSNYIWSTGATTQTINVVVPQLGSVNQYTAYDSTLACGASSTSVYVAPIANNASINANGPLSFCPGGSVQLTTNNGQSYLWSNGATTQAILVNSAGAYTVIVTYGPGCTAQSPPVNVSLNSATASISGNTSVCSGSQTSLLANAGISYIWSNGTTTQSLTTAVAGTYTVTVTNSNGCTGTAVSTVLLNSLPTPLITGPANGCLGTPVILNGGSFSNYLWSNGATAASISVSGSSSYTVTVTDANGCTGTDSHTININTAAVPVISGPPSICNGGSAQISSSPGFSSYLWNTGNTSPILNSSVAGTYTLTVTDLNGCTATASFSLQVLPVPVPAITGTLSACAGNTISLNAGGTYASYLWSSGQSTQYIGTQTQGIYTVTVTAWNGCTGSTTASTTILPNPMPGVTGPAVICQGNSAVVQANSIFPIYQWSNGLTTQAVTLNSTGTYTVTVTATNGCTASVSHNLIVNPNPLPSITGNVVICFGDTTVLTATPGMNQYIWSNQASTSSISTSTSGTYTVTITDSNGCSATTNIPVTVNQLPVPLITGPTSICDGQVASLSTGAYSAYLWSTGALTSTISATMQSAYTVTVKDNNGCTATTSWSLIVHPLPLPLITGDTAICEGLNTTLSTGSFASYQWSNGSTSQTTATSSAGAYIVTVTSLFGCTNTSAVFNLQVLQAVANITPSGPLTFCNGETVTLSANLGTQYLWSNGSISQSVVISNTSNLYVTVVNTNGCTDTSQIVPVEVLETPDAAFLLDSSLICEGLRVQFAMMYHPLPGAKVKWNFGNGKTSTGTNPLIDFIQKGNYLITLSVINPNGCSDVDSVLLNVDFPLNPEAVFGTNPNINSFFDPKIEFYDLSKNAVAWYWNFGDDEASFEQNPIHYFKEAGEHRVQLTVTNIIGCQDTREEVIIISPLFIPNTFTPNGDGRNEEFFTSNYVAVVQSFSMIIYNRWGGIVYECDSFNKPWDGNDWAGNPAPQGTYVYKINVTTKGGKAHEFAGKINLLR